jgi:hypothetical protein
MRRYAKTAIGAAMAKLHDDSGLAEASELERIGESLNPGVDAGESVPFESRYRDDFKRLNVEWLDKYFFVEPIDDDVLANGFRHAPRPHGLSHYQRSDVYMVYDSRDL